MLSLLDKKVEKKLIKEIKNIANDKLNENTGNIENTKLTEEDYNKLRCMYNPVNIVNNETCLFDNFSSTSEEVKETILNSNNDKNLNLDYCNFDNKISQQYYNKETINKYIYTCNHKNCNSNTNNNCLNFNKFTYINSRIYNNTNYYLTSDDFNNEEICIKDLNYDSNDEDITIENNNININNFSKCRENKEFESLLNDNVKFRLYKSLEKGLDLTLASQDLVFRNKALKSYMYYMINFILNANEVVYANNIIRNIINIDINNVHEMVNKDLFINKDCEILKAYIRENYIKNILINHNTNKSNNYNLFNCFNYDIITQIISTKENNKLLYNILEENESYEIYQKTENNDNIINLLKEKDSIKYIENNNYYKDKGFTSPRILILLPYKENCHVIINTIIHLVNGNKGWSGVGKKKKFHEEYSTENLKEDYFMLGMSIGRNIYKKNNKNKAEYNSNKSPLYNENNYLNKDIINIINSNKSDSESIIRNINNLFTKEETLSYLNNSKGADIELYTSFSESDIIIASPLALKESKVDKLFLSSIEILLLDFSEEFLNQNTSNLEFVAECLNQFPKSSSSINDIFRIKDNYKDSFINKVSLLKKEANYVNSNYSLLRNLRQNIFISHFKSLELESLYKLFSSNVKGSILIKEKPVGVVNKINKHSDTPILLNNNNKYKTLSIKFEFKLLNIACKNNIDTSYIYTKNESIFNNSNNDTSYDVKASFFTKNLYQNLCDNFKKHTLIFCSDSFDYIRLKKHFKSNYSSVVCISEDTSKSDWQRNRFKYETGQVKFMLYSERAHKFKKAHLRIVKNIIFYSLPEDPQVLLDLLLLCHPDVYIEKLDKFDLKDLDNCKHNNSAVIGLVDTKLELYNLEKAIGYDACLKLIKEKANNYII